MKLLIVTDNYNIGGPATYTRLLAEHLPQENIEVEILSFEVVKKLPKVIRHFVFFLKVFGKLRKNDIIFAQDPVSVGLPSVIATKILAKKMIVRFVGDYAWEQSTQRFGVKESIDDFQNKKYGFKVEFLRKIQIFVLNRVDKIITPSIYFGELVKRWLKNPDKVQPIYNGIDTSAPKLSKQEARQKLGISQEDIILFSAGRLVPWKGFDLLIDIMPDLLKNNNKYKLIITGNGPDKNKLAKQVKSLQLQKAVRFTGQVSRQDVLLYLQAADVFVLNTSFESFSFHVVEAMYYNVPVITTNVCNLPEIIDNNKEGILVDHNNKEQIIQALDKILEDNNFRENIIKQASEKAKDFSIKKTMDSVIEILQNL